MKPTINTYTDTYLDAKRLFNTLFHPATDKETLCTEERWKDGEPLIVETNWEIWEIFER